eukprot:scaffold2058_cov115-Isochrysis_galbana.AAC.18
MCAAFAFGLNIRHSERAQAQRPCKQELAQEQKVRRFQGKIACGAAQAREQGKREQKQELPWSPGI